MNNITTEDVLKALQGVKDPDLDRDLTDLGMITDISVEGARVTLTVDLTTPACPLKDQIGQSVREAIIARLEPVEEVAVNFDSSVRPSHPTGSDLLPGVKNILFIASGKGGVGKSTVAANIACALSQTGAAVGLLDADIYGPSLPTIFGTRAAPKATEEQRMLPVEKYGLKLISIGMMLPEGQPVIWRGPMLDGAMQQLLGEVEWGPLDYLILDLPPGTGDVQLSLSRMVPQGLAVVVTTPQDVALADVTRAVNMFTTVNIATLGLIENMSGFVCGHCGQQTDIFLSGGGASAAEKFGIELLGTIPLTPEVARLTDQGTPVVIEAPDSAPAKVFVEITGRIAQALAIRSAQVKESPEPPPEQPGPDEDAAPGCGFQRM